MEDANSPPRNESEPEEGEIDEDLEEGEIVESDRDEETAKGGDGTPVADFPQKGPEPLLQSKSDAIKSNFSKSHSNRANRKRGLDIWADYYKDRYGYRDTSGSKLNDSPSSDCKESGDSNDSWPERHERRRTNTARSDEKPNKNRSGGGSSRGKSDRKERKRERAAAAAAASAAAAAAAAQQQQQSQQSQQQRPPCRYWSMGQCKKGDACEFRHAGERSKKRDVCKFYSSGVCSRGNDCLYMHGDFPCKFFHTQSSCHSGDSCRFSHDPLTPETEELLKKSLSSNRDDNKQESSAIPAPTAPPAPPKIYNSGSGRNEEENPVLGRPHPSVVNQLVIGRRKKVLLPYPSNDVPAHLQSPLAGSRLPVAAADGTTKEDEEKAEDDEPQSEYGYQPEQEQSWDIGEHPNDWISEPKELPTIPKRLPYDLEPPPMPKQPRLEDNYRVYNEPLPLPPPPPPGEPPPPPPPPPPPHLQDETIFMRPPLPLPPPPRPFHLPPHGGGTGEFFDHPPPSGFDEGPLYHHHHHRDISPPVMIPIRDAYSPPRMPPPPPPPPLPHHHRFPHPHLHDMRPEPRRHFSPPPPPPPHSSAPAHLHLIQRELLPPEPPPPPPPRRFDDFEVRHFAPPLPPSFHAMPPDLQESGGGATRLRKSRWSPPEQEIEPIPPPRWVDARRGPPEDTHYEPPAHLVINQRGKMELPPRDESFLSFSGPFPQRVPLQGPLDDARNSVEDFSTRGGGPLTQSTVEASRDPRLRGKRSTSAVVEEEGGGEPLGPSVLGIKMDMPPSLKREDEKTTITARGPTLADMFRNIDPTASPFG